MSPASALGGNIRRNSGSILNSGGLQIHSITPLPKVSDGGCTCHGVTAGAHFRARLNNEQWLRVPICLLCTLDDIELWTAKGSEGYYPAPGWHCDRCASTRPTDSCLFIQRNAQTRSTDCLREVKKQAAPPRQARADRLHRMRPLVHPQARRRAHVQQPLSPSVRS